MLEIRFRFDIIFESNQIELYINFMFDFYDFLFKNQIKFHHEYP